MARYLTGILTVLLAAVGIGLGSGSDHDKLLILKRKHAFCVFIRALDGEFAGDLLAVRDP